jgi:HSP20 family protein
MFGARSNPFELMDRMADEMDRVFESFTRAAGFPRPFSSRPFGLARGREGAWWPRVESGQQGDRFFVRADLPGVKKDDIDVQLTDDSITIHGERKAEHDEEREGVWRSEREYGEFYRTIPLPDGVIAESANASFRDGVLEITMQAAPAEANRGRRLEIHEGSAGEQKKS